MYNEPTICFWVITPTGVTDFVRCHICENLPKCPSVEWSPSNAGTQMSQKNSLVSI